MTAQPPLLELDNLRTHFDTLAGTVRSVDGVSFTVNAGETLGVVGESGCGKSVTALSILRLVPRPPGRHMGGVRYRGQDLMQLTEKQMRQIRGNRISMIFQEPMTSLNPVLSVGRQIAESVQQHQGVAATMRREHDPKKAGQRDERAVGRLLQRNAGILARPVDSAGKNDRISHGVLHAWRCGPS